MAELRATKRLRYAPPTDRQADRGGASPARRKDDPDGHFVFELGENLTHRYKILSKMGEGTFGRVLECWDRERQEHVAIKVIRSKSKYRQAAMIEIDVLNRFSESKDCRSHCVQIRRWFDYHDHICIVFEKLGPSLFDFLKRNKYQPFPLELVREFGRQLLESVEYMHDMCLIHTDLKPENILLMSSDYIQVPSKKRKYPDEMRFKLLPKSSAIKLIDFGSTAFDNTNRSSIVSTRHYRAPEVILVHLTLLLVANIVLLRRTSVWSSCHWHRPPFFLRPLSP